LLTFFLTFFDFLQLFISIQPTVYCNQIHQPVFALVVDKETSSDVNRYLTNCPSVGTKSPLVLFLSNSSFQDDIDGHIIKINQQIYFVVQQDRIFKVIEKYSSNNVVTTQSVGYFKQNIITKKLTFISNVETYLEHRLNFQGTIDNT
jgi:hypothetical protein